MIEMTELGQLQEGIVRERLGNLPWGTVLRGLLNRIERLEESLRCFGEPMDDPDYIEKEIARAAKESEV